MFSTPVAFLRHFGLIICRSHHSTSYVATNYVDTILKNIFNKILHHSAGVPTWHTAKRLVLLGVKELAALLCVLVTSLTGVTGRGFNWGLVFIKVIKIQFLL